MIRRRLIFRVACYFALLPPALTSRGQGQAAGGVRAAQSENAFDVVSIRPSAKEGYSHWRTAKEGYSATNVTAQQLIFYAYSQTDDPDGFSHIISLDQVRGLPGWGASEQFDVTAKVDEQTLGRLSGLSDRERRTRYGKMLQPVLRERFHLEIRHERRDQPVYLLETLREGSKLVPSNLTFDKSSLSVDRGQIRAKGYKLDELMGNLTESTGRIVINQTHLMGVYDFQLKWRPDDETETTNASPSIYTAVKEQLGLMLVPSKGFVDTIAILSIERPTDN